MNEPSAYEEVFGAASAGEDGGDETPQGSGAAESDAEISGGGELREESSEGTEGAAEDAQPEAAEEAPAEVQEGAPANPPAATGDARQAAKQMERDKVYADLFKGQKDPYTGRPIQTEADYRAYVEAKAQDERKRELEAAGLSPETIKGLVDEAVAPLKQQTQEMTLRIAAERARAVQARAEQAINASLRNISAEMPEVKTLDDIAKLPTAGRFRALIRQGVGLEDAFFLANRDTLVKNKLEAARQAAINQTAGKNHLAPTGAGGGEVVEIPPVMAEQFREMNPDITDAEMKKQYLAYQKSIQD